MTGYVIGLFVVVFMIMYCAAYVIDKLEKEERGKHK